MSKGFFMFLHSTPQDPKPGVQVPPQTFASTAESAGAERGRRETFQDHGSFLSGASSGLAKAGAELGWKQGVLQREVWEISVGIAIDSYSYYSCSICSFVWLWVNP